MSARFSPDLHYRNYFLLADVTLYFIEFVASLNQLARLSNFHEMYILQLHESNENCSWFNFIYTWTLHNVIQKTVVASFIKNRTLVFFRTNNFDLSYAMSMIYRLDILGLDWQELNLLWRLIYPQINVLPGPYV